jgi:hypothetical protein
MNKKRGHARAHLHAHWRRAPHAVARRRILHRHAPESGVRVPLPFQQLTPKDEDITHCFLPCSSPRWSTTTPIDVSDSEMAHHPYAIPATVPGANYANGAAVNTGLHRPSSRAADHRRGGSFSGGKTRIYEWQAPSPR